MAEHIERGWLYGQLNSMGQEFDLEDALNMIENIPAADVAPVVYGRWEPRQDVKGFVRCSNCKDCNIYDDWSDGKKWRYCPNCGAKMRGGK